MAYTAIAAGDVDAKSPLTDDLMADLAANDAHLKSTLTDGASAAQDIETKNVTIKGAGVALTVDNDALVSGDLDVSGTLTCGSFVVSDTALLMMGW